MIILMGTKDNQQYNRIPREIMWTKINGFDDPRKQ